MSQSLQPGIQAPDFTLPVANSGGRLSLAQQRGKNIVLVFFPSDPAEELLERFARFQEKMEDFEGQGAVAMGISDAAGDDLKRLATERSITFPLLTDSNPAGATAKAYGLLGRDQRVLPGVFIADEEGLIRRVYEAGQYPNLPNPAMVARALKKLADVPRPGPVTPDDWQLGPPDAPVVLIEYADYQCGPCREAYRLLRQIVPTYGDKILWVHRHLPLRHSHPLAQGAAESAEAAGAQGRFWDMHERLFEAEGALEREQLIDYAQELGLDVHRFTEDLDSHRYKDAVNEDFKAAVRNKIKLPPALFINRIPLEGPRSEAAIRARIEVLLACAAQPS
jgi:peroxiredoxin/protein-disulfide isomerase